jgi:hypothetical protein
VEHYLHAKVMPTFSYCDPRATLQFIFFCLLDVIQVDSTRKHNAGRTLLRNAVDLPVRFSTLLAIESGLLCPTQWTSDCEDTGLIPNKSCVICGRQSKAGTGLYPSTLLFPCKYHSTKAPYSFTCLSPTLYAAIFTMTYLNNRI